MQPRLTTSDHLSLNVSLNIRVWRVLNANIQRHPIGFAFTSLFLTISNTMRSYTDLEIHVSSRPINKNEIRTETSRLDECRTIAYCNFQTAHKARERNHRYLRFGSGWSSLAFLLIVSTKIIPKNPGYRSNHDGACGTGEGVFFPL